MSEVLNALRDIVGAKQVLIDADCQPFETDWRKRVTGKALCVVRPANTQEVADIVKACVRHGVSIVPQGGNTGMVVGAVPDASGEQVVLSLQRLHRIRHLDPANATITAEAGVILQQLQVAASEQGLLYPLSLGSQGSCTLGGNLSTNAGGTQVVRYGNTRELCLGLEVVTAEGEDFVLGYDQVFVDQVTGEQQGTRTWGEVTTERKGWIPMLYLLHFTMLLPDKIGVWLMGCLIS